MQKVFILKVRKTRFRKLYDLPKVSQDFRDEASTWQLNPSSGLGSTDVNFDIKSHISSFGKTI